MPASLRCRVGAHHASERIAIRNADGGELELGGLADHLMRVRGAAQEREIGAGDEFGECAHANTPCTNHCGWGFAAIETVAVEPEAMAFGVLHHVVVAFVRHRFAATIRA